MSFNQIHPHFHLFPITLPLFLLGFMHSLPFRPQGPATAASVGTVTGPSPGAHGASRELDP